MGASALRLAACACVLVGGLILGGSGAGLASADPWGVGQGSHDRESSKDVNNDRPSLNRIIHRILSEHRKLRAAASRGEPHGPRSAPKPDSGLTASESTVATFAESDDEPDPDVGARQRARCGTRRSRRRRRRRHRRNGHRRHHGCSDAAGRQRERPRRQHRRQPRRQRRRRSRPTSSVIRSRTTWLELRAAAATGGTRTGSSRGWAMPSARSSRRRARQSPSPNPCRGRRSAAVPPKLRARAGARRVRRDRRRWRWQRLSRHRFRRFTRAFGADRRDPDATARCGPLPGIPARRRAGCRCSRCPRRDC